MLDKNAMILACGVVVTYLFLAFLEEIQKEISMLISLHHYNKHQELFSCIAIGCGFAFLENILFSSHFYSIGGMLLIAGTRLLLNSTIHVTGIALTLLYHEHLKLSQPNASHSLLHFLSVIPATILHAFFNLLYAWEIGFLSVPLVIMSVISLEWMYKRHFFQNEAAVMDPVDNNQEVKNSEFASALQNAHLEPELA